MRFDPEAFSCLLDRLSKEAAEAGEHYERLRLRIIRFLAWERAASPEDTADDVLDRVAVRLRQGEPVRDVASFALGVARMVATEERTRHARRQAILATLTPPAEAPSEPAEIETSTCLERCLQEIPPESRAFLLAYYSGDGRQRIENRKRLAREFELELNALRNRALRLREKLEECVTRCRKRRQLSRMMNPASGDSKGRKASGDFESLEQNEMISYLLDLLPEEQREPVRARLAEDPAYFDALQDLEHDLCDAYVRGTLDPSLQATLAELESRSGFWQERIETARALQQRRPATATADPRRKFLWGALATAASIAAVATAVLRQQPKPAEPPPPRVATVRATLIPGVLRDTDSSTLQSMALPPGTGTLALELEAEGVTAGSRWNATLRSAADDSVTWQGPAITATTADALALTIPAATLQPGAYRLQLTPSGTSGEPYEYAFRITR